MTRKDYELLSQSLSASIEDIKDFELRASREDIDEIIEHITANLASALAQQNKAFDRNRFLKACGL